MITIWRHTTDTCNCPPNNDPFLPEGCLQGYTYVVEQDGKIIAGGFDSLDDTVKWMGSCVGRGVLKETPAYYSLAMF